MAHQLHLEKKKYRQWVKAGLGLTYLREGIASFCEDVAKQQHKDILDTIKQTKKLTTVTCDQCTLNTLKPDHVRIGNKQCPLGQPNCNCWYPSGKTSCPNHVCDAIYDIIVTSHGFSPPAPNWKNTDTQRWCTDPWNIAKCFINAPGYEHKTSAADTDCTGLLHLIINNQAFHEYIQCDINGTDVFSKVIIYRNDLFHSNTMELEEEDVSTYLDDMIAILTDGKELLTRLDSQEAVKKLKELKREDFIITTKSEATVVHNAIDAIKKMEAEIKDKIQEFESKTKEKLEGVATADNLECLERRVTTVESKMSELQTDLAELKTFRSSTMEQSAYIESKLEFQKGLIDEYRENLLHVSALPLQPEGNLCDFNEVYVQTRLSVALKDDNGQTQRTDVLSLSDIFTKDGKSQKSLYVVGEARSGKTSFCKSLVNYWCLAHSEGQDTEDEFGGVEEMKRFEFLFYIPLRHCTDKVKVKDMLEEYYDHPILKTVLERESRSCLIVLDGLDEWTTTYQSKIPPRRAPLKAYTVITASRPWKINTLGITDNESRQKVILTGLDGKSIKKMIKNTIQILNKTFKKAKDPQDCENALEKNVSFRSLKHLAITLQQLICMWFDGRLHRTSRCALQTGMLDLFFVWIERKVPCDPLFVGMQKKKDNCGNLDLPQVLINTDACKSYSHVIHGISRLAFETLFNNTKETSLIFDSSTFERLKISNEIKTCCLKLGILSEDKSPNLSASKSRSSSLSFIHKSFQEYLAAVYIAFTFKAHMSSSDNLETGEVSGRCEQFLKKTIIKCATLDEILEQANVFILLCGLEPRIATTISKYIYDIVTKDRRIIKYRNRIPVHQYE